MGQSSIKGQRVGRVNWFSKNPLNYRPTLPTTNKQQIRNGLTDKGIFSDESMLKVELLKLVSYHRPNYKKYVIDEIANETNRIVLRTPPYHCELNPIEMVWAEVKGYVASNNVTFNIKEVQRLLTEGVSRVTPDKWEKYVKHVVDVEESNMWKLDNIIEDIEPFVIAVDDSSSSSSESDFADPLNMKHNNMIICPLRNQGVPDATIGAALKQLAMDCSVRLTPLPQELIQQHIRSRCESMTTENDDVISISSDSEEEFHRISVGRTKKRKTIKIVSSDDDDDYDQEDDKEDEDEDDCVFDGDYEIEQPGKVDPPLETKLEVSIKVCGPGNTKTNDFTREEKSIQTTVTPEKPTFSELNIDVSIDNFSTRNEINIINNSNICLEEVSNRKRQKLKECFEEDICDVPQNKLHKQNLIFGQDEECSSNNRCNKSINNFDTNCSDDFAVIKKKRKRKRPDKNNQTCTDYSENISVFQKSDSYVIQSKLKALQKEIDSTHALVAASINKEKKKEKKTQNVKIKLKNTEQKAKKIPKPRKRNEKQNNCISPTNVTDSSEINKSISPNPKKSVNQMWSNLGMKSPHEISGNFWKETVPVSGVCDQKCLPSDHKQCLGKNNENDLIACEKIEKVTNPLDEETSVQNIECDNSNNPKGSVDGISALSNVNTEMKNSNVGKIRVKDPRTLMDRFENKIVNIFCESNTLSSSKNTPTATVTNLSLQTETNKNILGTSPSNAILNIPSDSGNVCQSNENFGKTTESLDDLYKWFFNSDIGLKTTKMAEILHLVIADKVCKDDRIKSASKLKSEISIAEEKRRVEREYAENLRGRGSGFKILFNDVVESSSSFSHEIMIIALYYKILITLLRIENSNMQYVLSARFLILEMLKKNNYKNSKVLDVFNISDDFFKQRLGKVRTVVSYILKTRKASYFINDVQIPIGKNISEENSQSPITKEGLPSHFPTNNNQTIQNNDQQNGILQQKVAYETLLSNVMTSNPEILNRNEHKSNSPQIILSNQIHDYQQIQNSPPAYDTSHLIIGGNQNRVNQSSNFPQISSKKISPTIYNNSHISQQQTQLQPVEKLNYQPPLNHVHPFISSQIHHNPQQMKIQSSANISQNYGYTQEGSRSTLQPRSTPLLTFQQNSSQPVATQNTNIYTNFKSMPSEIQRNNIRTLPQFNQQNGNGILGMAQTSKSLSEQNLQIQYPHMPKPTHVENRHPFNVIQNQEILVANSSKPMNSHSTLGIPQTSKSLSEQNLQKQYPHMPKPTQVEIRHPFNVIQNQETLVANSSNPMNSHGTLGMLQTSKSLSEQNLQKQYPHMLKPTQVENSHPSNVIQNQEKLVANSSKPMNSHGTLGMPQTSKSLSEQNLQKQYQRMLKPTQVENSHPSNVIQNQETLVANSSNPMNSHGTLGMPQTSKSLSEQNLQIQYQHMLKPTQVENSHPSNVIQNQETLVANSSKPMNSHGTLGMLQTSKSLSEQNLQKQYPHMLKPTQVENSHPSNVIQNQETLVANSSKPMNSHGTLGMPQTSKSLSEQNLQKQYPHMPKPTQVENSHPSNVIQNQETLVANSSKPMNSHGTLGMPQTSMSLSEQNLQKQYPHMAKPTQVENSHPSNVIQNQETLVANSSKSMNSHGTLGMPQTSKSLSEQNLQKQYPHMPKPTQVENSHPSNVIQNQETLVANSSKPMNSHGTLGMPQTSMSLSEQNLQKQYPHMAKPTQVENSHPSNVIQNQETLVANSSKSMNSHGTLGMPQTSKSLSEQNLQKQYPHMLKPTQVENSHPSNVIQNQETLVANSSKPMNSHGTLGMPQTSKSLSEQNLQKQYPHMPKPTQVENSHPSNVIQNQETLVANSSKSDLYDSSNNKISQNISKLEVANPHLISYVRLRQASSIQEKYPGTRTIASNLNKNQNIDPGQNESMLYKKYVISDQNVPDFQNQISQHHNSRNKIPIKPAFQKNITRYENQQSMEERVNNPRAYLHTNQTIYTDTSQPQITSTMLYNSLNRRSDNFNVNNQTPKQFHTNENDNLLQTPISAAEISKDINQNKSITKPLQTRPMTSVNHNDSRIQSSPTTVTSVNHNDPVMQSGSISTVTSVNHKAMPPPLSKTVIIGSNDSETQPSVTGTLTNVVVNQLGTQSSVAKSPFVIEVNQTNFLNATAILRAVNEKLSSVISQNNVNNSHLVNNSTALQNKSRDFVNVKSFHEIQGHLADNTKTNNKNLELKDMDLISVNQNITTNFQNPVKKYSSTHEKQNISPGFSQLDELPQRGTEPTETSLTAIPHPQSSHSIANLLQKSQESVTNKQFSTGQLSPKELLGSVLNRNGDHQNVPSNNRVLQETIQSPTHQLQTDSECSLANTIYRNSPRHGNDKWETTKKCSNVRCSNDAQVLCSGCQKACYCSTHCQSDHWYESHHNLCPANYNLKLGPK